MKLFLEINDNFVEPEFSHNGPENEIALNNAYDSLLNPADYCSEYSFTFKLPRSERNNRLFGEICALDSVITPGGFNPAEKMKYFILSAENDVISNGVCYLAKIDKDNFHLNLQGTLSYVFNKLINSGWNPNVEDEDSEYIRLPEYMRWDGAGYDGKDPLLNKTAIWASWHTEPSKLWFDLSTIKKRWWRLVTDYGYDLAAFFDLDEYALMASFIGFAPTNQGLYPDFSADKWVKDGTIKPLFDNSDIDVGDGLTERQMCEYRSCYQQPYIYVYRLFQIYQEICNASTGYTLNMDERWYNSENPYVTNAVYMLPQMYNTDLHSVKRDVNPSYAGGNYTYPTTVRTLAGTILLDDIASVAMTTTTTPNITINAGETLEMTQYINLSYLLNRALFPTFSGPTHLMFNYGAPLYAVMKVKRRSDMSKVLFEKKINIWPTPNEIDSNNNFIFAVSDDDMQAYSFGVDEIKRWIYNAPVVNSSTSLVTFEAFDLTVKYVNNSMSDIQDIVIETTVGHCGLNPAYPGDNINRIMTPFMTYDENYQTSYVYPNVDFAHKMAGRALSRYEGHITYGGRCNTPLTFASLFKGLKPFTILLKFTKMLDLIWLVDDFSKTITVMRREDHFWDCMNGNLNSKSPNIGDIDYQGFYDITELVDYSKEFNVMAPSWDDYKVSFNYDEVDTDYYKEYSDRYGMTFGSKRILAQNHKTVEELNLFCNNEFDTIAPSIIQSDFLRPYVNYISGNLSVVEDLPQISNSSDGKSANQSNNFFFRKSNGGWNRELNLNYRENYVVLTDDTSEEINANEYCWQSYASLEGVGDTTKSDFLTSYERPRFDIASENDEVAIAFAPARERYHKWEYEPTMKYMYDTQWKNYIEQAYNIQSKKIECSMHISSKLYRRLKLNPLVKLKNCIYICSKIDSWNESSVTSKVTLVQINDIKQLTGYQEFKKDLFMFDDGTYIQFDNSVNMAL